MNAHAIRSLVVALSVSLSLASCGEDAQTGGQADIGHADRGDTGADTADSGVDADTGIVEPVDAGPDVPDGGTEATCSDDSLNLDETDVDCGGSVCPSCVNGKSCKTGSDCESGHCSLTAEVCVPSTCDNRQKDGDESDIDCGGSSSCPRCVDGKRCTSNNDCVNNLCNGYGWCEADACHNGRTDLGETDVDCGGLFCPACAIDKLCDDDRDCETEVCDEGKCRAQSCSDGRRNNGESDIDCGSVCPTQCGQSKTCLVQSDCAAGLTCIGSLCIDLSSQTSVDVRVQDVNSVAYSFILDPYAGEDAWMINGGTTFRLGRNVDSYGNLSIHTALRFDYVLIPKGATIRSAWLYWFPQNDVDSALSHSLRLNIYAEKQGNSMPFVLSNYKTDRPDQRTRTSAYIQDWIVRCNSSCTAVSEYDCPQRKLDCWNQTTEYKVPKDLKALVQEVVSLQNWAPGNALTFILVNQANDTLDDTTRYRQHRTAVGYDQAGRGAQFAPRLAVEFDPPAP